MRKIIAIALVVGVCGLAAAQEAGTPPQGMRGTPANLPDISLVGVIDGHTSSNKADDTRDKLEFNEVETAFQGYIYPEMKADVFLALHKHGTEYESEICEAKVSFLSLAEGLSAEVGKVNAEFGKMNKAHSHTRAMADQPAALTNFLGEHALNPQGAALKYLLPLPFYAQAQVGAWTAAAHEHHVEGDNTADVLDVDQSTVTVVLAPEETEDFSPAGKLYTARLNAAFPLADGAELELGVSGLKGKGSHWEHHQDNIKLAGADFTLKFWPSAYRRFTLQGEYLRLTRDVPVGKLKRDGLYVFGNYRFSKYWDLGARFDYAENAFPVITYERDYSLIATRRLTETTTLRAQYKHINLSGEKTDEGWLQLIFGLGPHSHEME
ncbi:MAG: hypothetical protein A2049_05640 [Elusimicrobia bacterium GWA2_62_23]|nr:MAG: hypothetical protein A2049_05640 [Elusimicrobia bacterium GWA2_62_23]